MEYLETAIEREYLNVAIKYLNENIKGCGAMKLKECIKFNAGLNSKLLKERLGEQGQAYTTKEFQQDMELVFDRYNQDNFEEKRVYAGDIVFSLVLNQAIMVSEENAGRLISQQMVKLAIDLEQIDPWYLLYALNESDQIKNQRPAEERRTLITNLKNYDLVLPELEQQKKIGEVYYQLLENLATAQRYAQKMKVTTIIFLNQVEKGGRTID